MFPTKPSGSYEPSAEKITSSGTGPDVRFDAETATGGMFGSSTLTRISCVVCAPPLSVTVSVAT
jgi:hypothetical protein